MQLLIALDRMTQLQPRVLKVQTTANQNDQKMGMPLQYCFSTLPLEFAADSFCRENVRLDELNMKKGIFYVLMTLVTNISQGLLFLCVYQHMQTVPKPSQMLPSPKQFTHYTGSLSWERGNKPYLTSPCTGIVVSARIQSDVHGTKVKVRRNKTVLGVQKTDARLHSTSKNLMSHY